MHTAPATPAPPAPPAAGPPLLALSRPTWIDYLLFFVGVTGSLLLAEMSGAKAVRTPQTAADFFEPLLAVLPRALFLPLGLILLWPLFHMTQRFSGREHALSAGEWLLGVAWLGALALAGGIVWHYSGTLPDLWGLLDFKRYLLMGYVYGVLSLAALAALLWLLDLASRTPRPWTHRFSLALLLWPLVPLAVLWFYRLNLE